MFNPTGAADNDGNWAAAGLTEGSHDVDYNLFVKVAVRGQRYQSSSKRIVLYIVKYSFGHSKGLKPCSSDCPFDERQPPTSSKGQLQLASMATPCPGRSAEDGRAP